MIFVKREERYAYCNEKNGGCGNADAFIPDLPIQHCSQCGKEMQIFFHKEALKVTCPNGHSHLGEYDKYCAACGSKLEIEDASCTTIERKPDKLRAI
jgi:predicted amidophosphoribosyltransferase